MLYYFNYCLIYIYILDLVSFVEVYRDMSVGHTTILNKLYSNKTVKVLSLL